MNKNKPTNERRLASVYIGAVGSAIGYGECEDTIRNLNIREGDTPFNKNTIFRFTKGFDARQAHIELFRRSNKDAILLLDADMKFEPDTLEKMRSLGLPYVSGYYMRRTYQPIYPVMFEYNKYDEWPFEPMTRHPTEIEPIGASGWGCVLIHREVFYAVEPLLKGEPFVIEDDMDVWPYDLEGMIKAIGDLNNTDDMQEIKRIARYLKKEFRPLSGTKENVGSDIRFPYFAKQAGYDLYLHPDVTPGHMLNYPIDASLYKDGEKMQKDFQYEAWQQIGKQRKEWKDQMIERFGKEYV